MQNGESRDSRGSEIVVVTRELGFLEEEGTHLQQHTQQITMIRMTMTMGITIAAICKALFQDERCDIRIRGSYQDSSKTSRYGGDNGVNDITEVLAVSIRLVVWLQGIRTACWCVTLILPNTVTAHYGGCGVRIFDRTS